MFCKYCGGEIDEDMLEETGQVYCSHCGALNQKEESYENEFKKFSQENLGNKNSKNKDDTGSFWWGVLGFFVPLAGLLLYILWQKTYPKNSKIAGVGALISVVCEVIFYVVTIIICSASGMGLKDIFVGYV